MTTKIDLEFKATLVPKAKSNLEIKEIATRMVVDGTRVTEVDDLASSCIFNIAKELKEYLIRERPKTPVEINIKYDKILQGLRNQIEKETHYKETYEVLSPHEYHEIMDMEKYYNLFA